MASSSLRPLPNFPLHKPTYQIQPLLSSPLPLPLPLRRRLLRLHRCRSATTTPLERQEDQKMKNKKRDGEILIRIRLAHQVNFGESVAITGSAKELGSWRKEVGMEWTEDGWVCSLRFRKGQSVEFKFIVLSPAGSGNRVWENGDNRVVEIPSGGGVYDMVCTWDRTDEVVKLVSALAEEGEEVGEELVESVVSGEDMEGELSPFVEQWQGREASFMRSNEHGGRERERRWDTSGLEGVPLRVVEGDRTGRNWWRKVIFFFHNDNVV